MEIHSIRLHFFFKDSCRLEIKNYLGDYERSLRLSCLKIICLCHVVMSQGPKHRTLKATGKFNEKRKMNLQSQNWNLGTKITTRKAGKKDR